MNNCFDVERPPTEATTFATEEGGHLQRSIPDLTLFNSPPDAKLLQGLGIVLYRCSYPSSIETCLRQNLLWRHLRLG